MITTYYAHSREKDGKIEYQTIKEHAENVAQLVCEFSEEWCQTYFAEDLGLLHDIGKYQLFFQRHILGEKNKVEHSICGAKEWMKYHLPDAAAYIIAGHHSGLPDIGTPVQNSDESTLLARLKRETGNYEKYTEELSVKYLSFDEPVFKEAVQGSGESAWKEFAFWIRMMFSCLVDADDLDTERFCSGEKERGVNADFEECARRLEARLSQLRLAAATPVEKARRHLQEQIVSHAEENAHIYYMNMPTGSGKTLASMRFALSRAIKQKKKRIIYAIPYTSIIDQNAKVFKDIFGADWVLEHHCNFDYEKAYTEETTRGKMMRSSENWDASIIVTTNIQLFDSIYGNRTGKLRKLHNMANSILVFDEVHLLPSGYFQPCLEAIKILTTRYGCEAVFLTATMPDFDAWLQTFKCDGLTTRNLIDDTSCFSLFERNVIKNAGVLSEEALLMRIAAEKNALVIVNARKTAKKLYRAYAGKKYHLSTLMTHADRAAVIEKVRESLAKGEKFCLFSTSLIEAGVDLDFFAVFREQAGLENLLQAAGRCNRSGKEGKETCFVYSFLLENKETPPSMKTKQYYTGETFERFENVGTPEAIKWYFDKLYADEIGKMKQNDFLYATAVGGTRNCAAAARMFDSANIRNPKRLTPYHFAGYAERFRLIEEETEALVIVDSRNRQKVEDIFDEMERGGNARLLKRKLQKYAVSLRPYEWKELREAGVIAVRCGIDVLANEGYYCPTTGLGFEDEGNYILF